VDYEFRTTVVPKFHNADDIKAIASQLAAAKRFAIQEFVPDHAMNNNLQNDNSIFTEENRKILDDLENFCKSCVDEFIIRRAR
jgi:pyruvate-formate lyase-activating enzyme